MLRAGIQAGDRFEPVVSLSELHAFFLISFSAAVLFLMKEKQVMYKYMSDECIYLNEIA